MRDDNDLWWHPTVEVLEGQRSWAITRSDCLTYMQRLPDKCVDLVFGSPPYEDRRFYGELDFHLEGQDWVDWLVPIIAEACRICKGLVALVVGHGKTEHYQWSATPSLLEADLHRMGYVLRNPPIYSRIGVMGSGGRDYLKANYERIVCVAACGAQEVPWSNNIAFGTPPKYGPGGGASYREADGRRVNQWGGTEKGKGTRRANGTEQTKVRPSHKYQKKASYRDCRANGGDRRERLYTPPVYANPGNIIHCKVGGNLMGHKLTHENEAPFALYLAEFFCVTFCPPNGIVYDPFSGSGTTLHACVENKRRGLATDLRGDQCELTRRRVSGITPKLIVEADERKREAALEEAEVPQPEGQEAGLWAGVAPAEPVPEGGGQPQAPRRPRKGRSRKGGPTPGAADGVDAAPDAGGVVAPETT